jgi:hypothetical protein
VFVFSITTGFCLFFACHMYFQDLSNAPDFAVVQRQVADIIRSKIVVGAYFKLLFVQCALSLLACIFISKFLCVDPQVCDSICNSAHLTHRITPTFTVTSQLAPSVICFQGMLSTTTGQSCSCGILASSRATRVHGLCCASVTHGRHL